MSGSLSSLGLGNPCRRPVVYYDLYSVQYTQQVQIYKLHNYALLI